MANAIPLPRVREGRSYLRSLFRMLVMPMGLTVLFVCFSDTSETKAQMSTDIRVPEGKEIHWQEFLLKNAPEPTFRFAVAHMHKNSSCFGYLYVTRNEVRYEVKAPDKDKDHGFRFPRDSVTEAQQWSAWGTDMPEAEFKFAGDGTYHFFRIREGLMENLDPESHKLQVIRHLNDFYVVNRNQHISLTFEIPDARSWGPLISAVRHFDGVLELANERLEAERTKSTSQVAVTQHAAPAPNPEALSKADILDLLKDHTPSAQVAALVKQKGVNFGPSSDDFNEIRGAGGGDDLIDAIKQFSPGPGR